MGSMPENCSVPTRENPTEPGCSEDPRAHGTELEVKAEVFEHVDQNETGEVDKNLEFSYENAENSNLFPQVALSQFDQELSKFVRQKTNNSSDRKSRKRQCSDEGQAVVNEIKGRQSSCTSSPCVKKIIVID